MKTALIILGIFLFIIFALGGMNNDDYHKWRY